MFNSYEEYMKSVLGYNVNPRSTYNQMSGMFYDTNYMPYANSNNNAELESLYPEIYKLVYPIVQKKCKEGSRQVNEEAINNMTTEICNIVEPSNEINVNVNLTNNLQGGSPTKTSSRQDEKESNTTDGLCGNRKNSSLLSDLVRILILREFSAKPVSAFPSRVPQRVPYKGNWMQFSPDDFAEF